MVVVFRFPTSQFYCRNAALVLWKRWWKPCFYPLFFHCEYGRRMQIVHRNRYVLSDWYEPEIWLPQMSASFTLSKILLGIVNISILTTLLIQFTILFQYERLHADAYFMSDSKFFPVVFGLFWSFMSWVFDLYCLSAAQVLYWQNWDNAKQLLYKKKMYFNFLFSLMTGNIRITPFWYYSLTRTLQITVKS